MRNKEVYFAATFLQTSGEGGLLFGVLIPYLTAGKVQSGLKWDGDVSKRGRSFLMMTRVYDTSVWPSCHEHIIMATSVEPPQRCLLSVEQIDSLLEVVPDLEMQPVATVVDNRLL